MKNSISFDNLVDIYKDAKHLQGNSFEILVTNTNCDLLNEIDSEVGEKSGISIIEKKQIEANKLITININAPNRNLGFFFQTVDTFLETYSSTEPENYYIFDEKFYSKDEKIPDCIKLYRDSHELIKIFKETSSHYDKSLKQLIYFDKKKISIRLQFKITDLQSINRNTKMEILNFFSQEDVCNKEQKINMFRDVVISVLRGQPLADFSYFIKKLDFILDEFKNSYNLFTSQFSYKKIKNEIEQFKLDETIKINKTLTDIQNQALGIPIATLIAATQMKVVEVLNTQYYINLLLCAGCVVFCILCIITISNQCSTLSTINKEIKRQKNKIKTEYQAIANNDIMTIYNELLKKVCCQRFKLALITLAVVFIALSSILFYYYVTTPSPIIDYISSFFITIPA